MSDVVDGFDVYVCTAVEDGPGCLTLRCPEPSCEAAVGPDMVRLLASEKERKRYDFLCLGLMSRVIRGLSGVLGRDASNAVEYDDDFEFGSYDVSCNCKYGFCWKCMEDALIRWIVKPCETIGKLVLKNNAEAENTNWILAYSKPCPKCKRSIKKNHGCVGHDGRACNGYAKEGVPVHEAERQRELAKKAIER
ncbi:putative transcription factor C2H2 family [Helianthus anomalus]